MHTILLSFTMSGIARYRQPPLPLKADLLYENYPTTRVTYTFATEGRGERGAISVTRKQELPFAPDASDKERLIRVLHEYNEACSDSLLHIHDRDRHTKAREVLRGDLKASWENTIMDVAATSDADFVTNVRSFLAFHMPSNAFLIQQEYLRQATKPYAMDCFTTANRLRLINTISIYLPGSGGTQLFPSATSIKNAFYGLMLPQWQLAFDSTCNQLDDDDYTLQKLISFMEHHRLYHNTTREDRHRQRQENCFQPYPSYPPRPIVGYDGGFEACHDQYQEYYQQEISNQNYESYGQYDDSHGHPMESNDYSYGQETDYDYAYDGSNGFDQNAPHEYSGYDYQDNQY